MYFSHIPPVDSDLKSDMAARVALGTFGHIKPMLSELSKRRDFTDMTFCCDDGVLHCHQFIMGSQSVYLKQLLLDADRMEAEGRVTIYLPGYHTPHLTTVLKFLYTGRLKITAAQVAIVKELLENVLRIDAKITLPESPILNGSHPIDSNRDPPPPDTDPKASSSDSHMSPPKKRFRDNNSSNGNDQGDGGENTSNGSNNANGSSSASILPTPLSPPHSVTEENSDCQVLNEDLDLIQGSNHNKSDEVKRDSSNVISRSPDTNENDHGEDIVVSDNDDESQMKQTERPPSASLYEAPRVIAKHTGGERVSNKHDSNIPVAPRRVAKRTGGPLLDRKGRGKTNRRKADEELDEDYHHVSDQNISGTSDQRSRTRLQTSHGQTKISYNEEDGIDMEEMFNLALSGEAPLPLPPPIPLPPEPGMVVRGGVWVEESSAVRADAIRQATKEKQGNKVKKYNYKPTVFTIGGKSKEETLDALAEDDGEFPCPYEGCRQVYARERSLKSHISRNHHENLKASCPECGKKLSTTAAISKHLLSHRPREFWPYFCPLCGRKFQAKGDLPKHFMTKQHIHEVPPVGTPEWTALCNQGVCTFKLPWKENVHQFVPPAQEEPDDPNKSAIETEPIPTTSNQSHGVVNFVSSDQYNLNTNAVKQEENQKQPVILDSWPPNPELPSTSTSTQHFIVQELP